MPDTKTSYAGIYGDKVISLVRNLIHIAPIEEKGHYYDWHIKPHVHPDLFQLFIIEQGSVEILFADGAHTVDAPAFFTIPKNVLHGFQLAPDMSGWVISLSDASLENMLRLDPDIIFAMDEIQIVKINLEDTLIADAYSTMHKCISEFNSALSAKKLALQYLVGMLLLRLYRIPASAKQAIRFSENADKIYFRRFNQFLKEANAPHKSVEEYAALMTLSPSHLNRICKNVTGKSPKDLIIDHSIHEAKVALTNLELSIAEVSYDLNFEDPGYFSRLFKKKTGLSPKEFRHSLSNK